MSTPLNKAAHLTDICCIIKIRREDKRYYLSSQFAILLKLDYCCLSVL